MQHYYHNKKMYLIRKYTVIKAFPARGNVATKGIHLHEYM